MPPSFQHIYLFHFIFRSIQSYFLFSHFLSPIISVECGVWSSQVFPCTLIEKCGSTQWISLRGNPINKSIFFCNTQFWELFVVDILALPAWTCLSTQMNNVKPLPVSRPTHLPYYTVIEIRTIMANLFATFPFYQILFLLLRSDCIWSVEATYSMERVQTKCFSPE